VLATAVGAATLASYLLVPSHGLLGGGLRSNYHSTVLGAGEVVLLWYVLSHANDPCRHAADRNLVFQRFPGRTHGIMTQNLLELESHFSFGEIGLSTPRR